MKVSHQIVCSLKQTGEGWGYFMNHKGGYFMSDQRQWSKTGAVALALWHSFFVCNMTWHPCKFEELNEWITHRQTSWLFIFKHNVTFLWPNKIKCLCVCFALPSGFTRVQRIIFSTSVLLFTTSHTADISLKTALKADGYMYIWLYKYRMYQINNRLLLPNYTFSSCVTDDLEFVNKEERKHKLLPFES